MKFAWWLASIRMIHQNSTRVSFGALTNHLPPSEHNIENGQFKIQCLTYSRVKCVEWIYALWVCIESYEFISTFLDGFVRGMWRICVAFSCNCSFFFYLLLEKLKTDIIFLPKILYFYELKLTSQYKQFKDKYIIISCLQKTQQNKTNETENTHPQTPTSTTLFRKGF